MSNSQAACICTLVAASLAAPVLGIGADARPSASCLHFTSPSLCPPRPLRPPNYFRFFCDKLLRSFAPRFLENVYRCRKISDVGCQQARGGGGGPIASLA